MKRHLFTYLFLVMVTLLAAQESRIVVSEDTLNQQNSKYDHLFSMISQERTKINTLLKINAVDLGQLNPNFSAETFIYSPFSIEAGLRILNFGVTNQKGIKYLIEPSLKARYYYNFKRRESLGKPTNGFSGNYFFGAYVLPFGDTQEWHTQHMETDYFLYGTKPLEGISTFYTGAVQLGYGLQRRIANFGYIDIRGGYMQTTMGNTSLSKKSNFFNNDKLDEAFKGNLFIKIEIGFGLTTKTFRDLIE